MNININKNITTELVFVPRKNKTNKSQYCIYLACGIYEKGIRQFNPSISTGVKINTTEWKNGFAFGRNDNSKAINQTLRNISTLAENLLLELSVKKIKTCSELEREISSTIKQKITGKAPRGFKTQFISRLKEYTYENIMNSYLEYKQPCKARKNKYPITIKLLNEYFENSTPNIDMITTEDLEGFKKWFFKNKRVKQNTATSYFYMITAVFNHAVRLKLINSNPLPKGFSGAFVDGKRESLTELEILKIIQLKDNDLTHTQQVAKYCMLVQCLTGMAYCDLQDCKHENISPSNDAAKFSIKKNRKKTGIEFQTFLSSNAKIAVDKLIELTGNSDKPFNIPSIEYSTRIYKIIGKIANINTNITTYTFRHSFAVDYMNNDGCIEDLQKILGHTDPKTTMIYGKISQKRLAEKNILLESKSRIHQIQTILKAV